MIYDAGLNFGIVHKKALFHSNSLIINILIRVTSFSNL